jgi:hypothetical protein
MATSAGPGEIRWRVLHPGMWAARRDDRHLGTVERGRRWLAVDADSEPIGRFRTLAEAQAAVASPGAHRVTARPARGAFLAFLTASTALIAAAWPGVSGSIR